MSGASSVLLLHEAGELEDVASMLRSLGIPFEERRGADAAGPAALPRDLLIAGAGRALVFPRLPKGPCEGPAAVRLAIVPAGAPDLRPGLAEAGFELLVRRPVHPTALRLLLLRLLYRGPERRQRLRVAVGTPIRYRRALLWRSAMLTELSSSGCRLLAPRGVPAGGRVRLELQDPASPAAPLRVRGRVVRSNVLGPTDPTHTLAVEFRALNDAACARLEQIVAAYAPGPASLPSGGAPASLAAASGPAPLAPDASLRPPDAAGAAGTEPSGSSGAERRRHRRAAYNTRVVTLGEEAAHVVMGRDLSLGGIRIEPHGGLERDQRVALAIHGGALHVPLVVRGTVARDEGEAGLVVLFDPLASAQRHALENLMGALGGIEALGPYGDGTSSVVTRVLAAAEAAALA